ncbi:hypothetical protein QTP70_018036, partial [Hemibagrus guttatus]
MHFFTLESSKCTAPRCDFVCDCTDCSDEQDCGYRGRDFVCDFEDAGACGWTDKSAVGNEYMWERRQSGNPLPNSGPTSDYTIGTSAGWFMAVSAVNAQAPRTAVLTSTTMQQSSLSCRLQLRYFMWDSSLTVLEDTPLWAEVWTPEGQKALVWSPERSSVRAWKEGIIFLGRIPGPFQIQIHSRRQYGRSGDIAIDQLEFKDCALPGGYMSCNFEKDLCSWDLRSFSGLKWIRTRQMNISMSEPLRGPGRDHSTNSAEGHFLYVTKPDELKQDWASFQSPPLEPTNSSHPCRMVMYTHQFGGVSGGLSVLVAEKQIYPVWERGGSLGDLWVKAEIEFVVKSPFQILFVAAIRDQAYGGIAVDDITLSPECRLANESVPPERFPKPPKKPCAETSKICDFTRDCAQGEDEAQCGDFSYEQGIKGWTDTSIGSQGWKIMENTSSSEVFLYVAEAAGQQLTEAQTRTPLLGPSGLACALQFSYSLTGNNTHIETHLVFSLSPGEVSVMVVGQCLEFRAYAQTLTSDTRIAVKDVRYVNCNPQYIPSSTDGLSCNFETDLCGWYQDQMDNYDWSVQNGIDHTIGVGRSLVVDMWSDKLRGLSCRLLSLRQNSMDEHCLLFFYKLYGPQTGALNVKMIFKDGSEQLLWTRFGSHGNFWQKGLCPVPQQIISYQLVFEAVRSGFDGQVAIDDVAFVKGPCSLPTMCSFEGQRCGYTNNRDGLWVHQTWDETRIGPKTDHSLETEMGYYMLAHSGLNALPQGSVTTLTSPIRHGVTHTECVHFWYNMGGHNPGTLSVYVKPADGDRILLFSNSLNQGEVWRLGMGNVSCHGDWQLQFEVQGGGGEDTFVAIDDISFSTHSCPTTGHFLFLPHTPRDTATHNAWLLSPHLPPTKGTCLYFWVHQPVADDSKLVVWTLSSGAKTELFSLTGAEETWMHFRLNVTSETEYQIVFEGLKGAKSVLALDDFGYTVGVNCVGEQIDQISKCLALFSSSSTNNTGVIAASVVVAILLMVTLAVLLFLYLRMREHTNSQRQDSSSHETHTGFMNDLYEPDRVVLPSVYSP